jgi:molybdopterin synthase sulfur carrier subunit
MSSANLLIIPRVNKMVEQDFKIGLADHHRPARGLRNGARSMATVVFTPNIQRHVHCPEAEASGCTVREVLENIFSQNSQARSYVLDDQSGLRKHMTIFVDGRVIRDRVRLGDAVNETSIIYVLQALSGG